MSSAKQSSTNAGESNGGRVVVLTVLGLLVLFGGAYVAAYAFAGAKVPHGASVAGIEIGGKTQEEAVEAVSRGFAERGRIEATVDGSPTQLRADQVGLSVDAEATVDAAGGGRSWAPQRLWDHYTGGDELDPLLVWDEAALTSAFDGLDEEFGTPPREGRVRFVDGETESRPGRNGEELDREAARGAIATAYVDRSTAELELVVARPEIDGDDVQQALNAFGNKAVSGPVTLVFDETRVQLEPADYAPALRMRPEDGELVPDLRGKRLTEIVRSRFVGTEGQPVDATVRLVNGSPQVVPSKPGVEYEPADVRSAFLELVVAEPGQREMAVEATVRKADFRTKEARALGITEQVSTFTTNYPHAEYRNVNLSRAAELIDGTVLKPGETFSMNDIVGERTRANGFTEGFIISNGVYKEELGGSVSQMATTLFNAMFFAGLEDVEHRPHSFYIDRYPVGREATIVWGALDLRFRNDTKYGVLVDTSVRPSTPGSTGSVTVTMYSTKVWDITTRTGKRHNRTEPEIRRISDEECFPNEGYSGFDIDVFRYFRRPGSDKLVRTEKFSTTYTPSDTVICEDPDDE